MKVIEYLDNDILKSKTIMLRRMVLQLKALELHSGNLHLIPGFATEFQGDFT